MRLTWLVMPAIAAIGLIALRGLAPSELKASRPDTTPAVSPARTMPSSPTRQAPPPGRATPTQSARPKPSPNPRVVPERGSGRFALAEGMSSPPSHDDLRYSIEVEKELPFDPNTFARTVQATLDDQRGWMGVRDIRFARVDTQPELRIMLATPTTADRLCLPLDTGGKYSCRNGELVVINAVRWSQGATTYGTDLRSYRQYVINHEVGHALGHGHQTCPRPGEQAPVMLQQTKTLDGCTANPWPAASDH